MNTIVLGCNSACPLPNGQPSLAQGLYSELRNLGGQGAVAGTNSFVWLNSAGTAKVAPDKGGLTWRDITEKNISSLKPDYANSGGYSIFGEPTKGLFQLPFNKQLDKALNGGSSGLGDRIPFAGAGVRRLVRS